MFILQNVDWKNEQKQKDIFGWPITTVNINSILIPDME